MTFSEAPNFEVQVSVELPDGVSSIQDSALKALAWNLLHFRQSRQKRGHDRALRATRRAHGGSDVVPTTVVIKPENERRIPGQNGA